MSHQGYNRNWYLNDYESICKCAEQPGSTLVIPIGSVEQHGNHLPTGTDTLLVESVVKDAMDRLSEDVPAVSTPVVWQGYSPHHMSFGGTITIGQDTLQALIVDIGESALDNGFDACILVNGHGGNKPTIAQSVNSLGEKFPDVSVSGITYFDLANGEVEDIRDSEEGGMAHAGEFETSLMEYYYPELVQKSKSEGNVLEQSSSFAFKDMFSGGPLALYRPFEEYSSNGCVGAPEVASLEKGEELQEIVVSTLHELILEENQSST